MYETALGILLIYGFAVGLFRASRKHFWFDEILSVTVGSQDSVSAIWTALRHAVVVDPPLFHVIEALCRRLGPDPHVSFRLAPLVGFLGIPVALFVFVRRRAGNAAGLTAATAMFITPLFTYFSSEARPYSLTVCCVAWALVMWQEADLRGRSAAFAAFLAAAVSLHFYAIFSFVPFGVAEVVRTARTRTLRPGVWLALFVGALPLAAFWPILSYARGLFSAHYFVQTGLFGVTATYDEILGASNLWGAAIAAVLAGVLALSLLAKTVDDAWALTADERLVILGFIALPLVGYVLARLTGGGMTPRYVMQAVLGVAVAAATLTARARYRSMPWLLVVLLAIFVLQQVPAVRYRLGPRAASIVHPELAAFDSFMQRSQAPELPVVVSSGMRFLPMTYYGTGVERSPVYYLVDRDAAVELGGTDSVEIGLAAVAPYLPSGRVQPAAAFLEAHDRFLVYAGDDAKWDWLPASLARQGLSVRPIHVAAGRTLYLVTREAR